MRQEVADLRSVKRRRGQLDPYVKEMKKTAGPGRKGNKHSARAKRGPGSRGLTIMQRSQMRITAGASAHSCMEILTSQ
ncbi:hypothetical protein ACLOJK_016526 [Asimina triloba]